MQMPELDVPPGTFARELQGVLEIDVEGTKAKAFSNHLKDVQVDYHPYGFEARVQFVTFDDKEMHPLFAQEKVMKATLTLKSTDPKTKDAQLLKLQGIVTERHYQSMGKESKKGVERVYTVRIKDAAQATWGDHFPIKIFVNKTMKDVLDAEKNPLIAITYDWDVLTEVSPILAYSLEFKRGLPPAQQVSFYAFLMWYLYKCNGILEYDFEKNTYKIVGKKTDGGAPIAIPKWISSPPECRLPQLLRAKERTIKHTADNQDPTDVDNPNGFQAVRKDAFDDSTYTYFPDQLTQKVQSKLLREKPFIQFHLQELAEYLEMDKLLPGKFVEFKKNAITGETWTDDPLFKGKPYRLVNISFHATINNELMEVERLKQFYHIHVKVEAEAKEETYVERPNFQPPQFPFFIPGMIFSEAGDKDQTTFNVVKHEKVPLGQYQVKVPLVEDKKKVVVPFTPHILSGQHYFPLCKDQKVMLAVYFQTAYIDRALDWQPLTRLPLDTQANQVVFGSNGIDKYVIEQHEFKDGTNSVFTIKQSSSADQTQTIQIQEKELTITVAEKGKNTVLIKFHRDTGFLVQLKDEESGVTQQSTYNTESITHLSKGKSGQTTIVQKPESISLEGKEINIKCEEMAVTADKTITLKATRKVFVDAPITEHSGKTKSG